LPLVLSRGAGAAARASIGVVIIFGVALATLITLFLIPILYNRLAKRTSSPDAVGRQLDAALGAAVPAE
jgi:multidrug efflux pump